jgi:hypothetical protein
MKNATRTATSAKQICLTRRSPHYWRVTFDHPPLNIFGPETIPQLDEIIIGVFAHQLEHSGGYTREDAMGEARKLLPDILSYDPRRPASFPHNGRTLTDDVVDVFFSILTNGKVTGDKVGPHGDLLDEFPYLGPPHE